MITTKYRTHATNYTHYTTDASAVHSPPEKHRGRGKTKKAARDIYKRTLDIEFERDRSIGLGSTIGDAQTDRQTDTHTHTHTHIFFF